MTSVQLSVWIALILTIFFQSSQGFSWACGTGECDANLIISSTVEKPGSGVLLARMCTSECRKGSSSYYWCDAASIEVKMEGQELGWDGLSRTSSWDYCSPQFNTDITGKQCASNHWCDNHGYGYSWCYTNTGHTAWNYCSISMLIRAKMPRVLTACDGLYPEDHDNPRCLSTG